MTDIVMREAVSDDLELLWEFLALATYEQSAATAKAVPLIAAYLEAWRRPEDFGFVAERDGLAIGATWARQFPPHEDPRYYVQDRTPEITIGVREHARERRVGERLLRALSTEASHRGLRLCLNVRTTNPAQRLYERVGFRPVPGMTVTNRVGGMSVWMELREPS